MQGKAAVATANNPPFAKEERSGSACLTWWRATETCGVHLLNCRKLATGEIKKAILSHSYKQYFLEGYRFTHNITTT